VKPQTMTFLIAINLCRSSMKIAGPIEGAPGSRTSHCKAAGATPGRAEDCSTSGSLEGSPWASGNVCQALGEVNSEPSLSAHEVVFL
jgi:hypothetical protein